MGKWMLRSAGVLLISGFTSMAATVSWLHLSSAAGQLPLPSTAKIATSILTGDFDGDTNADFMISFADAAPALVLFRGGTNFIRLPVELDVLPLARGGAAMDIDGDGDLDVVFGSDKGPEIWWWENPSPRFDPNRSWTRHLIKSAGGGPNRGQLFADIQGNSRLQLVFWNQASNAVFAASVPDEPRSRSGWDIVRIFSPPPADTGQSMSSLASADINLDGNADLLAGNYWLRRTNDLQFEATRIGMIGGRGAIGRFHESTYPQIVIVPENSPGPAFWYECKSNPGLPGSWAGRELLGHEMNPAASLAIADVNHDGNDDILISEAAVPGPSGAAPAPRAWLFYSDGRGNFRSTLLATGFEVYDAKFVDLDHDGDLDIVSTAHTSGTPRLDVWLNLSGPPRIPIFPK